MNHVLSNQQKIWHFMRKQKSCTRKEIVDATGVSLGTVRDYLSQLNKAGYTNRMYVGRLMVYTLRPRTPLLAPAFSSRDGSLLPPSPQQRMWLAAKVLNKFTFKDLSLTAECSDQSARNFCRVLLNGGYVSVIKGRRRSYTFLKSRDTGPLSPMIQRDGCVVDRNTGDIMFTPTEVSDGRG